MQRHPAAVDCENVKSGLCAWCCELEKIVGDRPDASPFGSVHGSNGRPEAPSGARLNLHENNRFPFCSYDIYLTARPPEIAPYDAQPK
ncbi:MAG TPA: hypothetical protein VGD50_07675 [Candidatus Baltobacteraceae bacterium]